MYIFCIVSSHILTVKAQEKSSSSLAIEILDDNYDQIQKGQWLIGFFDKETKESMQLEKDWEVFALKCKEQHINVGRIFAPQNPGFTESESSNAIEICIKNGVAHEVKQANRHGLIDLIDKKKWAELKPVNFLNNPFSVQMSLLSHLFVHAVNLYNYEDAIVKKFVPFSSATDICFGLTFIIVGTSLGLLFTLLFGVFQIFFMDNKNSDEDDARENKENDEPSHSSNSSEESDGEETSKASKDDSSVRKRK
ncbi:uncharacterized protein TNIN_148751 [Trichonephila inaurata madagascariensis]|uniref:Uncharacterized protein n=1 Tax=Trichonephila inaurata madagascariensis TaxID=2747483 RepID=A0A8X6WU38_9ARAC|nr:uncharacterized protein TNIN_148751 [Trichonephila inaurata madagascariensis]